MYISLTGEVAEQTRVNVDRGTNAPLDFTEEVPIDINLQPSNLVWKFLRVLCVVLNHDIFGSICVSLTTSTRAIVFKLCNLQHKQQLS